MLSYPKLREVYHNDSDWDRSIIFEAAPQIRTVKTWVAGKRQILECDTVSLPLPYFYFHCVKRSPEDYTFSLHVGISNTPISKADDKIYFPPLPNIYANFQVCQTPTSDPIKTFWMTRFGGIQYYSDVVMRGISATMYIGGLTLAASVGSLENWEKTKLDDITSVKWPFYTSFDKFINCAGTNIDRSAGFLINQLSDSLREKIKPEWRIEQEWQYGRCRGL